MTEICFADFETRSLLDLLDVGAYKYAHHPSTEILVLSYTFDDHAQGHIWSPHWAWPMSDHDEQMLDVLMDFILDGGYMVFWNAGFDRHIWNQAGRKYGFEDLPLEQVLCAQAQAEANNLPGKLAKAAECLGVHFQKDPKGQRLINQLCMGTRDSWDYEAHSNAEWMGHFRDYCLKDVLSTRDVWQSTRPLTLPEWTEYHASERINDRGVAVDVEFSAAAMQYARAEATDINEQLQEMTNDIGMTVGAHARKARWIHEQLYPDGELQQLTERPPLKKTPDKIRFSCDRATREAILDLITGPEHSEAFEPEHLADIIKFLELIEAGNSAAVKKFTAIVKQEVDGRVYGGYSFNGAGQTGRYSSRGIQVHNIIRAPVEYDNPNRAIDAVEDIMSGMPPDDLAEKYGYPVSRLLARLIRPTIVAPEGKMLVWGDWDQIEGRCLPWASASRGGNDKLNLYREGIDVYRVAAAMIFQEDEITNYHRQVGKVAELALGFGGGVGAFTAMGRGYDVRLDENKSQQIVEKWRELNPWCVEFWNQLFGAALQAYRNPGQWFPAGMVAYYFHPGLMHGTLICRLPCSRWIVYPQFRHGQEVIDDVVKLRTSYVKGFSGGYGRVDLWRGKLAENITQAIAASILRIALTRIDMYPIVVLHTHDEIVCEVPEQDVAEFSELLQVAMTGVPKWASGLPLSVSMESAPFYSK